MKTFPILYKKASSGAIQQWKIWLEVSLGIGTIHTEHGQVGGKLQETSDVITKGKNIGKANETTAAQQAELEAQAKWEKQLKKGYVETLKGAEKGERDKIIAGGVDPMLAHPFAKRAHEITYPCFAQPKLDGIRCIAILKDGKCTLWSRTRKLITGVPHIARAIEQNFKNIDIILDGELYNHAFKADFEKIVSFVRQETPAEGHEVVQYHVYDLINDSTFEYRNRELDTLFMTNVPYLVAVETRAIIEADVMEVFAEYRKAGYEGAMLRNKKGLYANKRSVDLQKVKEFDDAEFPIVGIEEGRGKLAGCAIFKCQTDGGAEFLAKMNGATARLKLFFENPKLWQGKKLTVQYQGLTGKEKVPRFPVGIAIRDYE